LAKIDRKPGEVGGASEPAAWDLAGRDAERDISPLPARLPWHPLSMALGETLGQIDDLRRLVSTALATSQRGGVEQSDLTASGGWHGRQILLSRGYHVIRTSAKTGVGGMMPLPSLLESFSTRRQSPRSCILTYHGRTDQWKGPRLE
jgi:hypothetical protein